MINTVKKFAVGIVVLLFFVSYAFSQEKFTLQDAFLFYKFYPNDISSINWMNEYFE